MGASVDEERQQRNRARRSWAAGPIGSIFKARSGQPYSVYDCSNFNGTSCPLWVPSEPTPS